MLAALNACLLPLHMQAKAEADKVRVANEKAKLAGTGMEGTEGLAVKPTKVHKAKTAYQVSC